MTPPSKGGGTIMTLSTLALVSLFPSALAGNFWHISDLHLDYLYSKGGNVSDWCHKGKSEEEGTSGPGAGPAGEYSCDSPKTLVLSALQAMHKFQPKPDFIIWTGDSAPHWRDPSPYIMNVTKSVFRHLDSLFPDVPVVAALGNHDASPPDQFPVVPDGENKTDEYYTALWQQGAFGDHIQEDGRETFQRCGFYSKVLKLAEANLRMIVLNTNIYYSDNFTEGSDPCGQLEWLNTTLSETSEPVFIVAHVPPGGFERGHGEEGMKINFNSPKEHAHDINQRFVQILTEQRNAKKIQGQLYGHLHTDTFRLFLDPATRGEAREVAFMASSVTPVVWGHINQKESGVLGTNPSVRLFTYNNTDFCLLDYSHYSLDIAEANKGDTGRQSKKKELVDMQSKKKELLENVHNSRRRRDVDVVAPTETELPKGAALSNSSAIASSNSSAIVSSNSSTVAETDEKSTPPPPAMVDPIATSPNKEDANVTSEVSGTHETKEEDVNRLVTKWKLLYNATTAFNVTDLSPSSMFQAVKAMVTSGARGSLFQAYYRHNTAGHPTDSCKEECWRDQLCTVTRLVEAELNSCLKAKGTEGFFYKSELLDPSATTPLALSTTTPAAVTTSLDGEDDKLSRVTNDNDNLTLPPLDVTTSSPLVDIELEVSTSPPIRSDQPKVEPVPEDGESVTTKAVSTVLGLLGMLVLCLLCALGYKKYRDSRYRNQEFLLTDSVFRYDGYSQLDDD